MIDWFFFQQTYFQLKKKAKNNKTFIEYVKLIVVIIIFLFSIGIYGYFTNINSTQGYFLRQANKEFQKVKIQYELSNLEITKQYMSILNKINFKD